MDDKQLPLSTIKKVECYFGINPNWGGECILCELITQS